jgi:hypothetical protein
MELTGETYLFNFSLIAITFTAVSALVMLLRQTMGGKLANFDVYLITSYISWGFAFALIAVLPSLVFLYQLVPSVHWAIISGLAAILHASVLGTIMKLRRSVAPDPWPVGVKIAFSIQGTVSLAFLFNAIPSSWQGVQIFATFLTIALAVVLWSFVRRIASLLGDKPSDDWDPKRG